MIHLVSGKALVAKLIPMRPILCVVVGDITSSVIGLALTDSYLGSASPLEHCGTASAQTLTDVLHRAIRLHKPGGLAFGLPMKDYSKSPTIRNNDDEVVLCERATFLRQLQNRYARNAFTVCWL